MSGHFDISTSGRDEESDHKAALKFAAVGTAVIYATLGYAAFTQGPKLMSNVRDTITQHLPRGFTHSSKQPVADKTGTAAVVDK